MMSKKLADYIGEIIFLITSFGSFIGERDALTSIILFFIINIKYEPAFAGPYPTNKQGSVLGPEDK